ncbi:hypothetical protein [Streptomyces sp. NPDC051173]|uniref:hypothetical protein n=1 Tax=Streptomyces sp. NPDC051173 TaxID=3155164 RepID=UPI00344F95CF
MTEHRRTFTVDELAELDLPPSGPDDTENNGRYGGCTSQLVTDARSIDEANAAGCREGWLINRANCFCPTCSGAGRGRPGGRVVVLHPDGEIKSGRGPDSTGANSQAPAAVQRAVDKLRARLDERIRPVMLFGLQDAELFNEPGRQRINEWADWVIDTVLDTVTETVCEAETGR